MGAFKDWMELNEISKKEPATVKWKSGFSNGIGKFEIQDEQYEVEFDEFTENYQNVAGIEFFRIKNNNRL